MTASRAARAADEEARAASVLFAIEELWLLQACIRHEVQQAEQWQSPLASLKLTTRSPTLSSSASRTGLPRRPSSSTARTARKGAQRRALEAAIGPVWETNHVWLILLVVVAFTAFPSAFAALFTALYVPLFLALVGIVARGGAFAFHHYGDRTSPLAQASYHFFSIASTLTPFTFGMAVGAAASGDIELADGRVVSGPFAAWLGPFTIVCGLIGLLLCAFLAASYMLPRTTGALHEDFRRRAIVSSLGLGAATTIAVPVAAMWAGPSLTASPAPPCCWLSV